MYGIDVREKLIRKDIAYAAIFDERDVPFVKKQQTMMNLGLLNPEEFYGQFERYYQDKSVESFEPLEIGKSGNKLVNEGLIALAEMQVGKRSKTFGVYAIGEGTASVNIRDDALNDEVSRLDIIQNGGTIMNRGSTCYYSLFFPKTTASVVVTETAILDSLNTSTDTMLLRTLFPVADRITHTVNLDEIFVGHIIYSGSI